MVELRGKPDSRQNYEGDGGENRLKIWDFPPYSPD